MPEVKQFVQAVHNFTLQLDRRFTYKAPTSLNDLPDNVCSATSLFSPRKKLKLYSSAKKHYNLISSVFFLVCLYYRY